MSDQQPRIELVIDELLLHGFPPEQRQHIGDVLERELARLFQERGIPPTLMHTSALSHIDGGAFQVPAQVRPDTIGRKVARALYSGLAMAPGRRQALTDGARSSERSALRQFHAVERPGNVNEGGQR